MLVWAAPTRAMNPSVPEALIAEALELDEPAARSEWFAEFRRDIESYLAREAIEAVVAAGRLELPPVPGVQYSAFVDPSGGARDSMTLAIAHAEGETIP